MQRKGFTLVELMIVFSIVAVVALILVGIINPIALVNKGNDARRKKDLARIKVAFEEYYNDKGCYPDPDAYGLMNKSNCGSLTVFGPWLVPWPCDPSGEPYEVKVPGGGCPNYYRAYTILDNTKDKDIPDGLGVTIWPSDSFTPPVNYGVSSPNVRWYDEVPGTCFIKASLGGPCWGNCQISADGGTNWEANTSCSGEYCYIAQDLSCKVNECYIGTFVCVDP